MDSDRSSAPRPLPDSDGLLALGALGLGMSIPFWLAVLGTARSMLLRTGEPGFDAQWAGDGLIKGFFLPAALLFAIPGLACWLRTRRSGGADPRSTGFRVLVAAHALPLLIVVGAVAWKLLAGPHREEALRDGELPWMVGGWLLLACVPLLVAAVAVVRGRWSGRTLFRIAGLGVLAWVWTMPAVLVLRSGFPLANASAMLFLYGPLTLVGLLLVAASFWPRPRITPTAVS